MNQQPTPPQNNLQEDEIDLIALAKTAWSGRRTIIKITLIFTMLGVFIAIFSPKQYSVTSVMVPQTNGGQNKLGGLSSLAAMAGFNLNMSSGSELNPVIYPQIVQSIPFQKELMYTKLNFEGYSEKISIYDYYTDPQNSKFNVLEFLKKFTIGLPKTISKAIRGKPEEMNFELNNENEIIHLSLIEQELAKILDETVSLNVETKDGYITLTTIWSEPLSAAQLGQNTQKLLQKYITEFKIEKAQSQLNFVKERYYEKKDAFESAQKKLARFRDQNKNVSTAMARTEEERLQSEYQIAQSVYTELAKQMENSLIQVKEETPIFSIIEPISVPTERFSPKRKKIVFTWTFFGVFFGLALLFGKEYFKKIKKDWQSHQ